MEEKSTKELENVLLSTHASGFEAYCKENKESMVTENVDFSVYFKELFRGKKITQQENLNHF